MDLEARLRLAQIVREARGTLSQRKFAEQLGVGQTSIQRWEKGKGTLTLDNLEKLAAYCQRQPEEMAAYVYGRELQVRSLEEVIENLPTSQLPMVLKASARRLRELTAEENGAGAAADVEPIKPKD